MTTTLVASALALATVPHAICIAQEPAPDGRPPNIVLILADDLGFECVGANGGTSYATPRIDRMAREGVRFEQCHSTPLCTPSRVQLMTGQYSFRNYERFGYLDPDEVTFGPLLREAGYATGVFGKWQLHYGTDAEPDQPAGFGFDEWCLWNSQWKKPGGPGSRYRHPRLDFGGEVRVVEGAYGPDVLCDQAVDFMRRHRAEPFFLYYPMVLPHSPFVATPESGEESKTRQEYFADMVAYTDAIVGRVLDALTELELEEHTLVIFVGDNGTGRQIRSRWRGQEIVGGKSFMKLSGTHVPCVAWWPGTAKPAVVTDLVDFTDFLPTLCEAASIDREPDAIVDGRSFLPRLRGEPGSSREWIFCHYEPRWNVPGEPGRYAFDGRYKLHHDGQLFDVVKDRDEEWPIVSPGEAALAARLELQSVLDSMPAWQ